MSITSKLSSWVRASGRGRRCANVWETLLWVCAASFYYFPFFVLSMLDRKKKTSVIECGKIRSTMHCLWSKAFPRTVLCCAFVVTSYSGCATSWRVKHSYRSWRGTWVHLICWYICHSMWCGMFLFGRHVIISVVQQNVVQNRWSRHDIKMQDISCNWGSLCKDNALDIKGRCIRKPKGNAK
jgi:hypothetical protein